MASGPLTLRPTLKTNLVAPRVQVYNLETTQDHFYFASHSNLYAHNASAEDAEQQLGLKRVHDLQGEVIARTNEWILRWPLAEAKVFAEALSAIDKQQEAIFRSSTTESTATTSLAAIEMAVPVFRDNGYIVTKIFERGRWRLRIEGAPSGSPIATFLEFGHGFEFERLPVPSLHYDPLFIWQRQTGASYGGDSHNNVIFVGNGALSRSSRANLADLEHEFWHYLQIVRRYLRDPEYPYDAFFWTLSAPNSKWKATYFGEIEAYSLTAQHYLNLSARSLAVMADDELDPADSPNRKAFWHDDSPQTAQWLLEKHLWQAIEAGTLLEACLAQPVAYNATRDAYFFGHPDKPVAAVQYRKTSAGNTAADIYFKSPQNGALPDEVNRRVVFPLSSFEDDIWSPETRNNRDLSVVFEANRRLLLAAKRALEITRQSFNERLNRVMAERSRIVQEHGWIDLSDDSPNQTLDARVAPFVQNALSAQEWEKLTPNPRGWEDILPRQIWIRSIDELTEVIEVPLVEGQHVE